MIFFVWSLVLSAIHCARRQRLKSMLLQYFFSSYSRRSMLICKRKAYNSCYKTNILHKSASEPSIHFEYNSSLLYHTSEVEIIVKPSKVPLDVNEWNLVASPTVGSEPAVYFIAFLGNSFHLFHENIFRTDSKICHTIGDDQNWSIFCDFFQSSRPLLISSLCTKIAYKSARPSQMLYECTVSKFCDVASSWSENKLFDANGKFSVIDMQVISLPITFFSSNFKVGSIRDCASFSAFIGASRAPSRRSLSSGPPMSFLEALYRCENDSGSENSGCHSPEVSRSYSWRGVKSISCFSTNSNGRHFPIDGSDSNICEGDKSVVSQNFNHSSASDCNTSLSSVPNEGVSVLVDYPTKCIKVNSMTDRFATDNAQSSLNSSLKSVQKLQFFDEPSKPQSHLNDRQTPGVVRSMMESDLACVQLTVNADSSASIPDRLHNLSHGQPPKYEQGNCLEVTGRRCASLSPVIQGGQRRADIKRFRRISCGSAGDECQSSIKYDTKGLSMSFPTVSYGRLPFSTTRRYLSNVADPKKIFTKPPTIIVYTGENNDLFNRIDCLLKSMITPATYTIYHLSQEALCKHPWITPETACFIIADTTQLNDKSWSRLQTFFNNGGKMLFSCQNNLLSSMTSCDSSRKCSKMLNLAFGEKHAKRLGKDFESFMKKTLKAIHKEKRVHRTFHAKDPVGGYNYSVVISKMDGAPLLLYMENSAKQASALFSDASSEQLFAPGSVLISDALSRLSIRTSTGVKVPSLTHGYFMCETDKMPWDMEGMCFNEEFGTSPKILIKQIKKHGLLPEPSSNRISAEFKLRSEHMPGFDDELYFRSLKTSKIGKAVLFIPVCETTRTIAKSLAFAMPNESITIVAQQQTKGTGRTGNQWISPIGCATFSFTYMMDVSSSLAKNVGFIQHIFCVAVVDGICSLHDELKNFPLKIKWPNDIYYGRSYKLGGLIVDATHKGQKTICTLGVGMNVANSSPTICINDLLSSESGIEIKIEQFIASTLNKFEYYAQLYENEGRDTFLKHYYRFWLHSKEEVTIADTGDKVVILGLDEYGYLEVRSRKSGQIMVVHPDGNTFDMMKGLIAAKYR